MRKRTAYISSVLTVAATTLTMAELARRWVYSNTKKETDPLGEDDPAGSHSRNEIIWKMVRAFVLPIGRLNWWLGNLVLVGKENVIEALKSGKGTQVIGNHTSSMDTFVPQTILWFHGFEELAEERFRYVIGMKFVNRRPLVSAILKGGSYTPIVPPVMLGPDFLRTLRPEERRRHLDNAGRINTIAFGWLSKVLEQGFWSLLFPEGTRVPEGAMRKIQDRSAAAFRHPGSDILPMAIIGADRWKPKSWIPRIIGPVSVIFGNPIPYEVAEARAKAISKRYSVNEDRALCDLVMRRIARLMIENGRPKYAGFYGKTRQERLSVNKKGGN